MAKHFSEEALKKAYEFLAETPPFKGWNLPESDEIKFKVAKAHNHHGWHAVEDSNGQSEIHVSARTVGHTASLFAIMGHEMVHLFQHITKQETSGVAHNASFRKLWAQVAKVHGFDQELFG